jgi:predicted transposase YbfD/YdcC
VPADPSFPIPSGLTPLRDADPLQQAETPHLLAYLATIPDPRAPRGHRHPLIAILAMAAAAVLAGARSMTAIAEWAADTPQSVRAALGARRESPDHYSVPARPPSAGPWAAWTRRPWPRRSAPGLATATAPSRAARQSRSTARRCAAPNATAGRSTCWPRWTTPPAQCWPNARSTAPGEVPAFQPLLNGLDLAGAVITADALHTHADAAEFLVTGKQAHYLFVVKANQPTLLERCAALAWHNVPVADRTRDRGHGRIEIRTLKAVSVRHFGFPHAAQVLQVTRKVCDLATRKWHTVVVYAITSLSFQQARPARLADLIRRHWSIENGLHWVRDVTFAEDASQLRTGTAPQVMSSLRNLAIGVLSRAGPVNLAAALRGHARDPARPLATLGISLV